jgi:type IV pilus assembly protein PilV
MNGRHSPLRTRGFSLIEIMVAVIVICIGLLGIAKMQALALSTSNTSRLRSLAAIEAASFAASMHSNRNFWGSAAVNYTVTPTAITSPDAATAAIANGELGPPTTTACVNNICDAQNLAAYDLAKFANSLQGLLPNPSAKIVFTGAPGVAAPASFTIEILWSENAISMTSNAENSGTLTVSPSYTLYVEP